MNIYRLTDSLYIAPQLSQTDVQNAVSLGIRSVICNRPDKEADGQPDFSEVKEWLADAGIRQTFYQPVVASGIKQEDINTFQALFSGTPSPVLAYCRTGTRSTLLWALHQVQQGMTVDDAMAAARKANVDLSHFEARLRDTARLSLK